jgi:GT2 family glycosyltransferase
MHPAAPAHPESVEGDRLGGGGPVTVVMITRDRCASAVRSVIGLRKLPDAPPIIVVDNGSGDDTVATLSDYDGVRVIAAGRNLGAAGRTLGVRCAGTPYVAFSDDDSWWAPGALLTAAELFDRHPRLGVVVGRTLVGPAAVDDPLNALLTSAAFGSDPDLPGPNALGFLACATVVRRSAFVDTGGFHPRFGVGGEEALLALDLVMAGWGIAYVEEVVAHHHPATAGERPGRRVVMARNDLWTSWLRRRRPALTTITRAAVRASSRDPVARQALAQAVGGLPWVVRQRRPVPPGLEEMLQRVGPRT